MDKNKSINSMRNSKPRVLFVNGFIYLPGEGGYKRTLYLFDMMKQMGYQVTLITTDFNHYAKKVRDIQKFHAEYPEYKDIEFIHMPAYSKNISVKRYFAEKQWVRGFAVWLKENINNYDVVYHHMPGMDEILSTKDIIEKAGKKMIVDIRDLRPEALRVVFKQDWLYNLVTFRMKCRANKAYAAADEMIAVSNEYLQRGMSVNHKSKNPVAVYIGSILDKFDAGVEKYSGSIQKKDGQIWITYAGTLGASYDLYTLLEVAQRLQSDNRHDVKFMILGQGPDKDKLVTYSIDLKLNNVEFVGFVDYEKMAAYLSKSDITVNSLKRRGSQSIINKVADYFAAGIPCLNGSVCKEMMALIDDYKLGINYEPENVDSLVDAIYKLIEDKDFSKQCGLNAIKVAKEKFDRKTSYLQIIERIDNIVK